MVPPMKSCTLAASLLLWAGGLPAGLAGAAAPAINVRPTFPALQTSGVVPITLSCTGAVTGNQTVAFGLPLPREFLADAANLGLESPEGGEIAADVTELARWRHLSDAAVDGRSVRSVLIAFHHDC